MIRILSSVDRGLCVFFLLFFRDHMYIERQVDERLQFFSLLLCNLGNFVGFFFSPFSPWTCIF